MTTMERAQIDKAGIGKELLAVATAAQIIDAHDQTIRNMIRDGRLAFVRIGKTIRIPSSEIERLKGEARRNAP